ncbi:MAG: hypothetical protein ACLTAN_01230 [Christensenellaceae bacterium]
MNKEQQIEEIAGTICNTCKERFEISEKCKNVIEPCLAAYAHAEALYNAGYRKIDENCAVITKSELKEYKRQAVKAFAERLNKDPRINNYGLEFVALVDIDAELKALLKEHEE